MEIGGYNAWITSEGSTSKYESTPNAHVAVFDAAFPGTLPKLNFKCVELALRTALALDAQIHLRSAFDRKHYFYADLPSGYQITQHYAPLSNGGRLYLEKSGTTVNIMQLQLEQDTAKSLFDSSMDVSIIDLNRAGTGLMEIVSQPDMCSPEQAGEFVRTLQTLLRSIGASDGNMEEGSLRCDANVSVNRQGSPPGTRCEIKNLNSPKFMMIALTSEIYRHIELLEAGKKVLQETRGFDERKAETYKLRSKEDAPDYRYMPDPNLPRLILDKAYVDTIRQSLPELPSQIRSRLHSRGLNDHDIDALLSIDSAREVKVDGQLGSSVVELFDRVSINRDPKVVLNWITHDLYRHLIVMKRSFRDNTISAEQLGELVDMVQSAKLTTTSAKTLLKHMLNTQSLSSPSVIAEELSLYAWLPDKDQLDGLCLRAIAALPQEAEAVRKGNIRVINKLMGYVMKSSRGRADAQSVHERLKQLLSLP